MKYNAQKNFEIGDLVYISGTAVILKHYRVRNPDRKDCIGEVVKNGTGGNYSVKLPKRKSLVRIHSSFLILVRKKDGKKL